MNKTSLLVLCLAFGSAAAYPVGATESTRYDELVRQARDGDVAPALEFLRQHRQEQTLQQRQDYIVIASWANDDHEVIEAFRAYPDIDALAPDVLSAVARAYRNLKQYDTALSINQRAQRKAPDDIQLKIAEIVMLADAQRTTEAIGLGEHLLAVASPTEAPALHTALAYALITAGRRFDAVYHMDRAFTQEHMGAFEREVLERYSQALTRGEMPMAGLEVNPNLTSLQRIQKQADEQALLIRLTTAGSRTEHERFDLADRIIERYATLITQSLLDPEGATLARQMRVDRLGGYFARAYHTQVVREYNALKEEGVDIPVYALRWVAHSLMELHQPEAATPLFQRVIAHDTPKDDEWAEDHLGYAYSLLESDHPREARQAFEEFSNTVPRMTWHKNMVYPEANEAWMSTRLLDIHTQEAYGNTPRAQRLGEDLCNTSNILGLSCVGLAEVYQARGWPRRAERQLKITESVEPRSADLETVQGSVALDLREWQQADVLTHDVYTRFPEVQNVQRLRRVNDVSHMAELRLEANHSRSHGNTINRGSKGLSVDSTLFSPRMGDNWRVFTGAGFTSEDLDEETSRARWQRVGGEYSDRDKVVTAEVSHQGFGGKNGKLGARLALDYDLSDTWHYGGAIVRRAIDTPLRARNQGIDADRADSYVRWKPSDRQAWEFTLSPWHYSDGNWRWQAAVNGEQRLWSSHHFTLDGLVGVETNRNLQTSRPYYSPKRDVLVMPGLRLTQLLHNRYERQWQQEFEVQAGRYHQKENGWSPAYSARYGHRVRFDDVLDAGLSVVWTRQAYDGSSERDTQVLLDVGYKF